MDHAWLRRRLRSEAKGNEVAKYEVMQNENTTWMDVTDEEARCVS
jgi:hypothetical protein